MSEQRVPSVYLTRAMVRRLTKKNGGDWVEDDTQPRRIQGTVDDRYPGVKPGETAPYTSSLPSAFAAIELETRRSDGTTKVIRIEGPVDPAEVPELLELLRDLLLPPAPAAAKADTEEVPPESSGDPERSDPAGTVSGDAEGAGDATGTTGAATEGTEDEVPIGHPEEDVQLGEEVLRKPGLDDGPITPTYERDPVTPGPAKRGADEPSAE